jgi:DNA-3-methyladenine glycosylase II
MENSPRNWPDRLSSAVAHVRAADARMADLIDRVGPCTLEPGWDREPYEALVRAVAYQQIHGKAAAAILGRFLALDASGAFPEPGTVLEIGVDRLRACGFSARKAETIRGIAAAAESGLVPERSHAETLDDNELVARLTTLRGIGPWTVEMLLIFTLGRLDVLPLDDFGVRDGYRILTNTSDLPSRKALAAAGAAWAPFRSVAAWYLWRTPR